MYWLPKVHKTPIGARFLIVSENCSTKPLSGAISKIFKIPFKHVESFHKKNTFYLSYKKFWFVENSFSIIEKLVINTRKRAKNISTLYTTISHNLSINVLSEIIHIGFKSKVRSKIGFSPTSIYWTSKGLGKRIFTEKSLIDAITFLTKSCYFTIRNMVLKQDIGIVSMWNDLIMSKLNLIEKCRQFFKKINLP